MATGYYIDNDLSALEGRLLECLKCKRKVLVEIALFGVSHNAKIYVTCAECLSVDASFNEEHPDIVKDLEEWAGRKIEIVPEKKSEKNSEST